MFPPFHPVLYPKLKTSFSWSEPLSLYFSFLLLGIKLHLGANYSLEHKHSRFTGKCKRCWFSPWVGKIPWRRAWQPTPVFLPKESHGQRNLVGYSPWYYKRVRHNLATNQQQKQHKWLEVPSWVLLQILDLFETRNFSFPKTNTHIHTPSLH